MHLFQFTAWTVLRWIYLYIEKYVSVCVPSEVIRLSLAFVCIFVFKQTVEWVKVQPQLRREGEIQRDPERSLQVSQLFMRQMSSHLIRWCWKAWKEQRKVFRRLLLSQSNVFCHRLILIQQKCERCSLLPTFLPAAAAPSVPFLALERLWQSLDLSMNTHGCLWMDLSVWGLLHRLLLVGSDVSRTEFQRERWE